MRCGEPGESVQVASNALAGRVAEVGSLDNLNVAMKTQAFRFLQLRVATLLPWLFLMIALPLYAHTVLKSVEDALYGYYDPRFFEIPFEQRVIASWMILFVVAFLFAAMKRQQVTAGILSIATGTLTFYGLLALA